MQCQEECKVNLGRASAVPCRAIETNGWWRAIQTFMQQREKYSRHSRRAEHTIACECQCTQALAYSTYVPIARVRTPARQREERLSASQESTIETVERQHSPSPQPATVYILLSFSLHVCVTAAAAAASADDRRRLSTAIARQRRTIRIQSNIIRVHEQSNEYKMLSCSVSRALFFYLLVC